MGDLSFLGILISHCILAKLIVKISAFYAGERFINEKFIT